ncbi:MAG TPA: hypothetical protein VI248_01430, partial [Kineosporiaceae bacterium]
MSGRTGRRRSEAGGTVRTALALAVAALLGTLILPAAAPATAATDTGALPVAISLTTVDPVALTPQGQLTVTGTVRNTGRIPLSGLQVNLRLAWKRLADRRELMAWVALPARDASVGTIQATVPLPAPLLPEESLPFTVTMRGNSSQLAVTPGAFGPRGMTVEVQQRTAGIRRVGIVRTFTVWEPAGVPPSTQLALLVPITAGATPLDTSGTGQTSAGLWSPTGRLAQLLDAAADPAFTYAVDPSVPAAALAAESPLPPRVSGQTAQQEDNSPAPVTSPVPTGRAETAAGSPGPGSGSSPAGASASSSPTAPGFDPRVAAQAAAWLKDFVAAARGRQTISLPFGDPDVAALAAAGHGDLVDLAERVGAGASQQVLGAEPPRGLIWPLSGRADATTAALTAHAAGRVLLLPSSAVSPAGGVPVHGSITAPDGQAEVLLADDVLSSSAAAIGGSDAALAVQRLLAETAVLASSARTPGP